MTQRLETRHMVARHARRLIAASAMVLLCAQVTAAQTRAGDPGRGHLTRVELQQLLATYDSMAASNGYSGALREQARRESSLVRQRLNDGDIREGDRILLLVEGKQQLSDTFNVVAGRRIHLPELGELQLAGVLRSELHSHVETFVARFVRNPTVHVSSLMRVEIRGEITQPGFYTVPSDYVLTDVLMMAGGPTSDAELKRLRIARADEIIWDGHKLRDAMMAGQTLDQLSVRTGDVIELPESKRPFASVLTVLGVISTLTSVILLVRGPGGS